MSNDKTTIDRQAAQIRMSLADRLRDIGATNYGLPVCDKAADEIDRLTAQVAMLRSLLEDCSGVLEDLHGGRDPGNCDGIFYSVEAALNATQSDVEAWQAAQAALPASPDFPDWLYQMYDVIPYISRNKQSGVKLVFTSDDMANNFLEWLAAKDDELVKWSAK